MFNGRPRTFVRVSMLCQFAGTRVSVDSIFQMVPGGVSRFNVGVAGVGKVTLVEETIFADEVRPHRDLTTQFLANGAAHWPSVGGRGLWSDA